MMDDHELLSRARNELADALKVLLNPAIMTPTDFRKALLHAVGAVDALAELLANP